MCVGGIYVMPKVEAYFWAVYLMFLLCSQPLSTFLVNFSLFAQESVRVLKLAKCFINLNAQLGGKAKVSIPWIPS